MTPGMEDEDLAPLDLAILKYVADKHQGAWKARIHSHIEQNSDEYVFVNAVSAQTIGRHVDHLVESGFLAPSFVAPDEVDQTYVTGFTITEEGQAAMDRARSRILEERIALDRVDDEQSASGKRVGKTALIEIVEDEFDIAVGSDAHQTLEQLDVDDVLIFLTLFYNRRRTRDAYEDLQDTTVDSMKDVARNTAEMKDEIEKACGACELFAPDDRLNMDAES